MSSCFFLASDAPLEAYSDPGPLVIDVDRKKVTSGSLPGRLEIWPRERVPELPSKKKYFAEAVVSPGCEERAVDYLLRQLGPAGELELWHVWLDGAFDHRVRRAEIHSASLTREDIEELERLEVSREPVTDYCYLIT